MVGVAVGAGLKVSGGLDTSMIERGFERVRQSFDGVKGQAKSFTSDLKRMDIASSSLVKKLSTMSIVGVTAIAGLASKAPAVAGSMAMMGVQFDRLTRVLGSQFAPEFAKASQLFKEFVTFVEAHPDLTKGLVFGATAVTGFVAAGKFVKILGSTMVSASLLKAFGTLGILIAAAIAAKEAGEWVAEQTYEDIGKPLMETLHTMEGPVGKKDIIGQSAEMVVNFLKGLLSVDIETNRRDVLLNAPDLE